MKKAQGLPISTIILAAIGLVVLILLFAMVTGKLAIFSRGAMECPGQCLGEYKGDLPEPVKCDEQLTRDLPGNYVLRGQQSGLAPENLVKCSKCCAALS